MDACEGMTMGALGRFLRIVLLSAIYAVISVFVVTIVANMVTDYLIAHNEFLAKLMAGTMAVVTPIAVTFGVKFVLKKLLNNAIDDVFMSIWAFLLTLAFVLGLSYHFNDGFGNNGLFTFFLIVGMFLTYSKMDKRRTKHHKKRKEEKAEAKKAEKEAKKEAKKLAKQ